MNKIVRLSAVAAMPMLLAAACQVPSIDPPPIPDMSSATMPTQAIVFSGRLYKDVDVLFVIDNSPSMAPKQRVLAAAIPQFINAIDATGANYNIGITTTDVGYNPMPGLEGKAPWNAISSCNTYSGDDGTLQNTPCTNRTGLQGEAATACAALCPDPKYVPANGARFISKVDGITNVPVKMMGGIDIGPQLAFQCMALVGDVGCGVEQQLESAKRALDDHRPDNAGFHRSSSVLAVIFITDEDDCSVQLMNRPLFDPTTPGVGTPACDISAPNAAINPACFNIDYRCIARDLSCAEGLNTVGSKTSCTERADTLLYSIDKYATFFAGLPNPKVVIAGIWSPTLLDNPSANPAKDGQLYIDHVTNQTDSAGLNRGLKTRAACYNPDPSLTADASRGFFGQAQLRLSSFVRRFPARNTSETSVCDAAGYPGALASIANKINSQFYADCLPKAPVVRDDKPDCQVGYVDAANPQATPATLLPLCSASCCNYFATDPQPKAAQDTSLSPNPHLQAELSACSADPDCYCAAPSTVSCTDSAVAGVWRTGNALPPVGQVASFRCTFPQ